MSDNTSDDDSPAETAWERRRRLEAVFGDDLPTVTTDETGPTRSDADHSRGPSASDRWLEENRPPHHG